MLYVFIWMLHILQWLYMYVVSVCSKCFTYFKYMLQVFYLDVAYVVVVIHICCKRVFQLFHLVSICCSRCCSPCTMTHRHARVASTHPVLPIFVMRVSSNNRTCTQRAISAQIVEHPLVKVHACMQSAKVGQHPTDAELGAPAPSSLVPHGGACSQGQHGYARYVPTLSLDGAGHAPRTCTPV
jgi:hypothetical protein